MNYTQYGTWYTDSEDSTVIHIVHYCEDTNDGETDSYGTGCSGYSYEWCSSTEYNTDTFNAQEMCCICGGGAYNDDSYDSYDYGIWYHIDGSIGTWTVTTEGESGEWSRDDDTDSGTWSYDDGTTTIGTWQNSDNTESGQWVSTIEDSYTRYIAVNPVGVFHSIDESSGYWTTYANETDGGLWIRADGTEHGSWAHDDGSTTTGTWETTDGDSSG